MAAVYLGNLLTFFPQYTVATILAVLFYVYTSRTGQSKDKMEFILRPSPFYRCSPYRSPALFSQRDRSGSLETRILHEAGGSTMATKLRPNSYQVDYSILTALIWTFFNPDYFRINSRRITSSPMYSNPNLFQVYRIFLTVIAWASVLFLITPFRRIYVFLPHLSFTLDIIVAVILSVSVFEAVVSFVYFAVGISLKAIITVEIAILSIFTLSLLAPSMSWFNSYSIAGKITIFATLTALFMSIGAIIPQLRSRDNIFKVSFTFTFLAYAFIIFIIMLNLLGVH